MLQTLRWMNPPLFVHTQELEKETPNRRDDFFVDDKLVKKGTKMWTGSFKKLKSCYLEFAAVQSIIHVFPDALFPVGGRNWTRTSCVSLLSLPPCVSVCSRASWFSFVTSFPVWSRFPRRSILSPGASISFLPWGSFCSTVTFNSPKSGVALFSRASLFSPVSSIPPGTVRSWYSRDTGHSTRAWTRSPLQREERKIVI